MILLKSKFVQLGQIWFTSTDQLDPSDRSKVDAVEILQSPKPLNRAMNASDFHTLTVDLLQSEEEIKSHIHKNTWYKINRSAREKLTYTSFDQVSPELLSEFCDFYDSFAEQKNRGRIGRPLMESYREAGALHLSSVKDPEGNILTWHANLVSGDRARLLQSASHFRAAESTAGRSLIGRGNRFHHWEDFLAFKKRGLKTYDFGGWYAGKTDTEKLQINQFKEEFGGIQTREFNGIIPVTIRGRIYYFIKRLKSLIS